MINGSEYARTPWLLTDPRCNGLLHATLEAHKHTHDAGTLIDLEGEESKETYCVLSGWLALSKSLPGGHRQIIDFALPGDFLNLTSANNETSPFQVEAITDARVSKIPEAIWQELRETIPQLKALECKCLGSAVARMSERMLRLGKASAEARIAHALLELCLRLRAICQARDDRFHLSLTQQQLGEFVGLSSVHVSRTLTALRQQGILMVESQMDIHICDMDALAMIAGCDLDALEAETVARIDVQGQAMRPV